MGLGDVGEVEKTVEMKSLPFACEDVPRAVIRFWTGADGRGSSRSAAKRVETQPVPGKLLDIRVSLSGEEVLVPKMPQRSDGRSFESIFVVVFSCL